MSTEQTDIFDDIGNPLDSVEDILSANDWAFHRTTDDELCVHVTGRMGSYQIVFLWEEDHCAMQICCLPDVTVPSKNMDLAMRALGTINAKLWLGHFDIRTHDRTPCFRHTSLFHGMACTSGAEHIGELIEIALRECERYYPAFNFLCGAAPDDEETLALALLDAEGES